MRVKQIVLEIIMEWLRILPVSRFAHLTRLVLVSAAFVIASTPETVAQTYTVAKTKEGVQRKAVITVPKAKLFSGASGDDGKEIQLMEILFILEGGVSGDRTPVSWEPEKTSPDGWLTKDTFEEWNSLQMVDFAPQGGRELTQVFDKAECAIQFSRSGQPTCPPIGREPNRQSQNVGYKILIPVFRSQADSSSVVYEGGFVRVTAGPVVAPAAPDPKVEAGAKKFSGYDLVLVIDSTISMQKWFRPTLEAVSEFVSQVKASLSAGEVKQDLRIGLLFYQDRKIGTECQLDFITQWRVPLTENAGPKTVDDVKEALAKEREATCGSDEEEEAVFDAVNRAILDPAWKDGSFRVVAVIGDADPHANPSAPNYEKKNPLHLDTPALQKLADEKNVRFLTMRISRPDEVATEFERLALERVEALKGRFQRIPADPAQVRVTLSQTLWKEWTEIVKPFSEAVSMGVTKNDPAALSKLDLSAYAYPIILNMLPQASSKAGAEAFSHGWVPQKILNKEAVSEYIFMRSSSLQELIGFVDIILARMEDGRQQPAETFIDALRKALASQLKVRPEEIFQQGEPLSRVLYKARVLPFETGVLRFTAEEINQWHAEDYARVINILKERVTTLREHAQRADNIRYFGQVKYFYIPQNLFP